MKLETIMSGNMSQTQEEKKPQVFFLIYKPIFKLGLYCGHIDYRTISEMMGVGTLKEGQVYQGNRIHVI